MPSLHFRHALFSICTTNLEAGHTSIKMQVSAANALAFLLKVTLLATVAQALPSQLSRSLDGHSLATVHNVNYQANGVAAKKKAIAKYAHLLDSTARNFRATGKSSSITITSHVLC